MKDSNIRLATLEDIPRIYTLFESVIRDLRNNKINIWDDVYPFCVFEENIRNKDMYVLEDNGEIIGSFAIIKEDDPEYHKIDWKYKSNTYFYLYRVAIDPEKQGKGYSKRIMDYVIKYAIDHKYEVIRLSVYDENPIAILLYENYGFIKVENSYYEMEDRIFHCYEKFL